MPVSVELRTASRPGLAGTLWQPDEEARATVLMVPGSGPTDRHNDTYFPPIRDALLDASLAVASFDKRGVGGSEGDWRDTDPIRQAADVSAQLASVRDQPGVDPAAIGLFGHSQGGWVVVDVAAADPSVAFVVTNSGPGVTWAQQGRYAAAANLRADGATEDAVGLAVAAYDRIVGLVRAGADFATVEQAAADANQPGGPADAAELELARRWLDHDPRTGLARIAVPVLALFGTADLVVPVDDSVAVFRSARAGRPGGVTIETFEGADHRIRIGRPPTLHPDYRAILTGWIHGTTGAR